MTPGPSVRLSGGVWPSMSASRAKASRRQPLAGTKARSRSVWSCWRTRRAPERGKPRRRGGLSCGGPGSSWFLALVIGHVRWTPLHPSDASTTPMWRGPGRDGAESPPERHCPETTAPEDRHATLVRTAPDKLHVSRDPARGHLRPAPRAGPDGRGRRVRPHHGDGPPVPDPGRRAGHGPDDGGLVDARSTGPRDDAAASRDPRDRRHLPEPCPAGKDRDHPRRHLGRSGDPRPRGCMERRRARRLRVRIPGDPRADGPPRRGIDDHPRDVQRGTARASRAATTGSRTPSTSRGRSNRVAHASWWAAVASNGP